MTRPKTISDEQVLDTLHVALMEKGPDGFTFARAAKACGLSPATLVQRYGAREALIQAILLRAWDRLDAETEAADAEEEVTTEGAIRLLLRLMPPETAERDTCNGLLLLREDVRNPVLRRRGAAWGDRLAQALGRRLSKDPARVESLGWQMASLWQGAIMWWALKRNGPPDQAIRRTLEEWCVSVC